MHAQNADLKKEKNDFKLMLFESKLLDLALPVYNPKIALPNLKLPLNSYHIDLSNTGSYKLLHYLEIFSKNLCLLFAVHLVLQAKITNHAGRQVYGIVHHARPVFYFDRRFHFLD